jgi:hypothetical protein
VEAEMVGTIVQTSTILERLSDEREPGDRKDPDITTSGETCVP